VVSVHPWLYTRVYESTGESVFLYSLDTGSVIAHVFPRSLVRSCVSGAFALVAPTQPRVTYYF
jgi:hypothetical protein